MHGSNLFDIIEIPMRWEPIVAALVVFALAAVAALLIRISYRRRDGVIPTGGFTDVALFEYLVETIDTFLESILDKHAPDFSRFLIGIFFFILFSNLLGLIPGFIAPTANFSINLAMAVTVFLYYNYVGIKHHGLSYFKVFLGPVWWLAFLMLPIEIISHFARILSLSLRLTGNISGEHTMMGIFSSMVELGVPALFLFLGLLTAVLQAFVFMTLSAIYILLSLEIDH
ncbi:MAG TPA: F0F1 ATP synthase subunit A [bacterium]|nr:F0F1 ATP synthase subunit A [bacterium]